MGQERGFFFGRDGQVVDGRRGCAEDGRLGQSPGDQARRRALIVAHELREHQGGEQTSDTEQRTQSDLADVGLEAPEALRPNLVTGHEEKQIEEESLDKWVDLALTLVSENAGQQGAHHGAEAKRADLQPADPVPQGERCTNGHLLMWLQQMCKRVHDLSPDHPRDVRPGTLERPGLPRGMHQGWWRPAFNQ